MIPAGPESSELTELVELPVIISNGQVMLIPPDLKQAPTHTLQDLAVGMDGIVGYIKVRAYYTAMETSHCTHKGCWRPVTNGQLKCDSHG